MIEVKDLSHDERVFFAGCLRGMIHADGYVKDEYVAGLNQLRDVFEFTDLDDCLDEFERTAKSTGDLLNLARTVHRKEARDLILDRLDEISRLDGYKSTKETEFYDSLVNVWKD